MIRNIFRTAFRTLNKYRSTTLLNIFGLAAGMTSAILIFLWVQNELSFDRYHPDANRIYRITAHITSAKWTWATAPLALAQPIRAGVPAVESLAAMEPDWAPTFRLGNELITEKQCAYVDSGWFSVFHYDFLQGSAAEFFRHPFSLILTQSKAKQYFGDKNPIGRTVHIDTLDYRVAGVIKDIPANSSFRSNILIPVDAYLSNADNRKNDLEGGNFNYFLFLKLRPGADPGKVAATLTRILNSKGNNDNTLSLTPLKDVHFETGLTYDAGGLEHGNRNTVYIFTILGIFLLVIACINYVNLTTARASLRAKEVGVRKMIGAGKRSLFSQFIIESLAVSALSLLVTIVLAGLLMPAFRELTGRNFAAPLSSPAAWKIIG
ncbi:MAG TPA: ABC transporter permease, partial [Puia sp.]|nr:ABC transporter permease [Puia sp.]